MKPKPVKHPSRTWVLVVSLGTPLTVVVAAAFVASFRALTDVGVVNGVQPAWLLPVVVDVGMITTNIASVLFRTRGLTGRWWANTMFGMFAAVSVFANVSHAQLAADFTRTTLLQATVIAALFPVAQLGLTHLVMMLIPDEKERQRLQLLRHAAQAEAAPIAPASKPQRVTVVQPAQGSIAPAKPATESAWGAPSPALVPAEVGAASREQLEAEVREQVLQYVAETGERPSAKDVASWLGRETRTGYRFLTRLEKEGVLERPLTVVSSRNTSTEGIAE